MSLGSGQYAFGLGERSYLSWAKQSAVAERIVVACTIRNFGDAKCRLNGDLDHLRLRSRGEGAMKGFPAALFVVCLGLLFLSSKFRGLGP